RSRSCAASADAWRTRSRDARTATSRGFTTAALADARVPGDTFFAMTTTLSVRDAVATSLREAPIVGVVRTATIDEAERQARTLIAGGVTLIEIPFSVPR